MNPKNIVILGSTGSIGVQALDIIREHPDRFNLLALSCNNSWEKMAKQIKEFEPEFGLIANKKHFSVLNEAISETDTTLLSGKEELLNLATLEKADIVLNSLVGYAGFEPTLEALKAGNKVALANKESLVVGGALINKIVGESKGQLIPVDSEHSAMLQCLLGEPIDEVENLIITASGGPFRTWNKKQMEGITVDDALNHPNWSMGAKITVDSATMMNKGLEIIEAHWLFDIPYERIEAVVHPESIIHSVVTFNDGSSKAQLGPPTMKVPIMYAFTYPDREELHVPRLDWGEAFQLNFEPVDYDRFPCLRLALEAGRDGGFAPAILNAANEVAVSRFLKEEISYIQIADIIESSLVRLNNSGPFTLESLKKIDKEARKLALTF
ncbi:1-deoxy-D-xylulose-5-phosphate reductoisomerase [Aliifodinibius salicampi]|uniref:1-deoxy-D-xylulose 5-phosphate reductoisomerase n=1 Tax=Fodinibius salicampi TaxID=1920655 RepID=A0ABT3PW53_9BACT|nr:1-deoxy-D-xylulose-5-phosphate reductoisomerase [Fodinibius salicampi]MCW9712085.1 1-deoxy-D-xylulose-5-phosphate reductoisomerase [Fodinibius salicampi]